MRSPFSGPRGLSSYDSTLRGLVRQGRFADAYEYASSDHAREAGDDLLALLNLGLLAHYAGRYEESNEALQEAERIVDERFTRSASRALLSLLTSDLALAYVPTRTERWMINYYGALNYLAMDDPEEAAVEARRLSYLLDQADERPPAGSAEAELRRALRYFAGSVFEVAGEWNDAAVSYRHVWSEKDSEARREEVAQAPAEGGSSTAAPDAGEVVVVVESGFVAHREERFSNLSVFPEEALALGSSDDGLRYSVASCVAARSFEDRWDFEHLSGLEGPEWSLGEGGRCLVRGRGSLSRRSSKRQPFKLRIAWPRMRRTSPGVGRLRVAAALLGAAESGDERREAREPAPPEAKRGFAGGDGALSSLVPPEPELRVDLSGAVIEEFEESLGSVIVKTIARSAARYAIVGALEPRHDRRGEGKKDGDKGDKGESALRDFARLTAAAAVSLFERADTRSWKLLPDRLTITRLRLSPGRHEVRVRVPTLRAGRRFVVGTFDVRTARVGVVEGRVWP